MRDIELWEAVALSLNLEPDKLPVYLGAYERFGDDAFRICPPPFLDRLQVANSNCGIGFAFKFVHKLRARCLVDLPEFAAWAVKQNIRDLPPELMAMAETMPVVPTQPQATTPSPAPVETVGASLTHSTRARRDTLTPVIELAQSKCRNPKDTAEVWAVLLVLAEKKQPPLIGVTEEGLQYYEAGEAAIFKRKSLGARLTR